MLLGLNELVEDKEEVRLERANVEKKEKLVKEKGYKLHRKQKKLHKENYKLRELRLSELYNSRYREEKEDYLRKLEANKAYLNLLN